MISRKMWSTVVFCSLGSAFIAWTLTEPVKAQDKPKKDPPKKSAVMQAFMKVKLTQSQNILEGLTTEDFDQIEKNASAMFLLTKAEQWNASKDPQFIQRSNEFARFTSQLAKYAKEKNLEGASLMNVQLTLSCIECHRFLREDMK
jgi:hypothetical protein